jgi:hypothetical protein
MFPRFSHSYLPGVLTLLSLPLLILALAAASGRQSASQSLSNFTPQSVHVYVNDFELFASAAAPPSKKAATSSTPANAQAPVYGDMDAPSMQARRLMDFFAITLVQSLEKSGYTAYRTASRHPGNGVLLRGVFAEPDAQNRIRRALQGGGAPGGRFYLYVGTFNLAQPEQPLYQPAAVQASEPAYGPVITLNNYIPMAKYEMAKNPVEDDVRKICAEIVENLTTLLNKNPSVIAH